MSIRPATAADADAIWRIFHAVVAAGDTYTFLPDTPKAEAVAYFIGPGIRSWVIEDDGNRVIGMYKLVPNHGGLGSHVANASFMVDPLGLQLIDRIGVENVMWSSDYPHNESTFGYSEKSLASVVETVGPEAAVKIVSTNVQRFLGIS